MTQENPFAALCSVASKEDWCWKLYCTTCGNREFRFGLYQLGEGIFPNDAEWRDPAAHMRSAPAGELQRITNKIRRSAKLHGILAEADLRRLQQNCKFPDFLGYLGLALFFTMEMEYEKKLITSQWIPQLRSMVPLESAADQMMSRLLADKKQLQWSDLEKVERDFIHI